MVQKPEGPNTYDSKNPAIAIWQPCSLESVRFIFAHGRFILTGKVVNNESVDSDFLSRQPSQSAGVDSLLQSQSTQVGRLYSNLSQSVRLKSTDSSRTAQPTDRFGISISHLQRVQVLANTLVKTWRTSG